MTDDVNARPDTIDNRTRVPLGTMAALLIAAVSIVAWAMTVRADVSAQERRIQQLEQRFDRIEASLLEIKVALGIRKPA